jgi:hypothetical protein
LDAGLTEVMPFCGNEGLKMNEREAKKKHESDWYKKTRIVVISG